MWRSLGLAWVALWATETHGKQFSRQLVTVLFANKKRLTSTMQTCRCYDRCLEPSVSFG